jgi:S1-C subfamily serine protease
MTVRKIMRVGMLCSALLYSAVSFAQTPAPSPPSPKKPTPPIRAGRLPSESLPAAPQVVTIVHRLNGLKMFRLLLRSEEQVQAIAGLDSAFNLMDDVHTNVIAGLALDDGETIAAWLPEAEVEFGPPAIVPPVAPLQPKVAPRPPAQSFPEVGGSFFSDPDVTVIGTDGKRLAAKYIGLDAVTGLSILRLTNKLPANAIKDQPVKPGETVLLFGPEPATRERALLSKSFYVRRGAIEGRIQNVLTAPSGDIARFKVRAARLSPENIGGVALNLAGETIGIVDGLEAGEASILPVSLIRRAAERVLEQQASVPRPWLGVKGEAIADLNVDQILNHGWEMQRAAALAGNHHGIMLTSIAPGSPAALAALRAGDVILKVDDKEIENAEAFTWWLDQAGASNSVRFTVARPDRPAAEPLSVKLSGMLDPSLSFTLRTRLATSKDFSLIDQGIETIALKPPVASQLGTTAGLLVVYVEPLTAAFEAGLQPGDVIQSINGQPVSLLRRPFLLPRTQAASFTFQIVRKKEKLVVHVANPAKKK